MSELGGEAIIELRGDDRRLMSDIDGAGSTSGKRFSSSFGRALKGLGALVAGAAVAGFLKNSIAEAREAQKVGATTAQIIKATGGAANITAKQVGNLAGQISRKAGVDDEAIQSGANLLLTFKNVRNEVGKGNDIFNRATQAAVDLSAAGFGSIEGGSKMLGKALNDPLKGISALSRAGVTFTDQQKKQIETLVKSGNTLGAQKLIMKEVESQVGGVAAASATAGDKFKVAFGNMQESVGTALLPIIDAVLGKLTEFMPVVSRVGGAFAKGLGAIPGILAPIGAKIRDAFAGGDLMGSVTRIFNSVRSTITTVVGNIITVLGPLASQFIAAAGPVVTGGFKVLASVLSTIGGVLSSVTGFLASHATATRAVLTAVVAMVAAYKVYSITLAVIRGVTVAFAAAQAVLNAVMSANPIGIIVLALVGLAAGLIYAYKHSETFRNIVQGVFKAVGSVISAVVGFIGKYVPKVFGFIVGAVRGYVNAYRTVVMAVFNFVKNGVTRSVNLVRAVVSAAFRVVGSVTRAAAGIVRGAINIVVGAFRATVAAAKALAKGIGDKLGDAIRYVKSFPSRVKNGLGNLGSTLLNAGKALISGLIRGIQSRIADAVQAVKNGLKKIKDMLPGSPIKSGPLVSWNNGGAGKRLIDQGLIAGINARAPALEASMRKAAASLALGHAGASGWTPPAAVRAPVRPSAAPVPGAAAGRAAGGNATFNVHLPTGDPEAAASAMWSRWVLANVGG